MHYPLPTLQTNHHCFQRRNPPSGHPTDGSCPTAEALGFLPCHCGYYWTQHLPGMTPCWVGDQVLVQLLQQMAHSHAACNY
jgi:hypothetical protein